MRKKIISALMTASLLLLSACGDSGDITGEIQKTYSEAPDVTINTRLRADYGENVYDFALSCDFSDEGGTVTITEPEEISGVTARVEADGVTLSYEGAEVFTGTLLPDGMSPVESVGVMLRAWREGYVTESASESYGDVPCQALTFRISDTSELRTWFDRETLLPLHAEIYSNGFAVILCDFENVIVSR